MALEVELWTGELETTVVPSWMRGLSHLRAKVRNQYQGGAVAAGALVKGLSIQGFKHGTDTSVPDSVGASSVPFNGVEVSQEWV